MIHLRTGVPVAGRRQAGRHDRIRLTERQREAAMPIPYCSECSVCRTVMGSRGGDRV